MKIKIIFLSIILAALSTGIYGQKQDASATVQSFYKYHLARLIIFKAVDRKSYRKVEIESYRRRFSDDLNKLFQTELQREQEFLKKNPTDKPHFGDGFPFAPLDECDNAGQLIKNTYQVGVATVKDERAIVEVKFYQPKECGGNLIDTYKVELLKSKENWLINDWFGCSRLRQA